MIGLVVMVGIGFTPHAQAQDYRTVATYDFPMVGIVLGETIRLNVVNRTGGPGDLPPDPCRVDLQILDHRGNLQAQYVIDVLDSGQATHLDLPAANVRGVNTRRKQLRAFVRVSASSRTFPPDPCRPSVEVYDGSTGGTKFVHPPPEPELPAVQ
jgi:hypothetical protein